MKKFLLFIIFSIFCFSTSIAQIAVESFRILPTDQTARITDPVIDQNGEKCALIKVATSQTGFVWEGGMLGITKVEKKTGEFWVYVPHGAKKITIKHAQLGILRDYIYTEAIYEATVYEMVLTTDEVTTVIKKREIKSQWVVITTEPDGADVYLDDKHCGQTPFQQEFKEGKHTYRISKDLYHTEAGQFELKSEEGKKKMDFNLRPNYGFVNIKSSPEDGAAIYIDDVTINKVTPNKTDRIKSGKHSVLLTHKWYENAQKEIEVKDGETTELIVNMNPKFAEVIINVSPDAEIFIDGKLEGSGHYSKRLIVGNYTLEIKKAMYHDITENIEVKAGEPLTKQYKLQPAFGGITIETSPESGAEVTVDGTPTGKTTPCTLGQLPSGEHLISLRREWYEPKKFRIIVEDGKSQNITQELIPTFVEVTITTNPIADIYIDMQKVGNGTYTGRVKTGIHTFEARKDKHHTDRKKEEIILDNIYNINLSPIPKYGTLKVVSEPFDANITLNGKDSGTTPKTFYDLLVGEYTLSLSKSGYATYAKTVTITEGETESINTKLSSTKQVTINSTPQGAKLYINNNYKGTTPITTGLSFDNHKLKLTKDKYHDLQISKIVSETTNQFNFELEIIIPQTLTSSFGNIEFIFVKGGTFRMGSNNGDDDEKPIHTVTVDDFYIGKYEVTQKQWKEIMGNNPSYFKGDNLPVGNVRWNDVQKFIEKLNQKTGKNYRLPTEAEWEYAARGGVETIHESSQTKYAGSNNIGDVAWYSSNSGSKTHAVGTKQANELGIYDMSGNVWEWCSDWYGSYSSGSQNNPQGASSGSGRVLRGGSWLLNTSYCRIANRLGYYPGPSSGYDGFRLVR